MHKVLHPNTFVTIHSNIYIVSHSFVMLDLTCNKSNYELFLQALDMFVGSYYRVKSIFLH